MQVVSVHVFTFLWIILRTYVRGNYMYAYLVYNNFFIIILCLCVREWWNGSMTKALLKITTQLKRKMVQIFVVNGRIRFFFIILNSHYKHIHATLCMHIKWAAPLRLIFMLHKNNFFPVEHFAYMRATRTGFITDSVHSQASSSFEFLPFCM